VRLIIHRGSAEIGGSCVELQSAKSRILIDFGIPLVDKERKPYDARILDFKSIEQLKKSKDLPNIEGLYKSNKKDIDGILISHSHLDHYGLLRFINQDIPVYMSEGAGYMIEVSNIFSIIETGTLKNIKIAKDKEWFSIGDFRIRPYLVDHSAFDALAFLIEADGKRIFYSGDFRGHGRKSYLFKEMLKYPPENIDCLLMEGSTIGRGEHLYNNEEEVQTEIEKILCPHNNISFITLSSQNIDRLVSAYKACLRTNSLFVIDLYTAFILYKLRLRSKNIPQFDSPNIRIYYFKYHADKLAEAGYKKLLNVFNSVRIKMPELNAKKERILMLLRDNTIFEKILKHIKLSKGAKLIYSMWEDYLNENFEDICYLKEIQIEKIHTSGHANVNDLKKFAEALNPKKLVPIHTFEGRCYPELFKNTQILQDGEVLDL